MTRKHGRAEIDAKKAAILLAPCEEPGTALGRWAKFGVDVTVAGRLVRKGEVYEVVKDTPDVEVRLSGEAGTRSFWRGSLEPCEGPSS